MADKKRQALLNNVNTTIDDKQKSQQDEEKDLLTLMIEAEHEGQGHLTDEEFEVNNMFFLCIDRLD